MAADGKRPCRSRVQENPDVDHADENQPQARQEERTQGADLGEEGRKGPEKAIRKRRVP